MTTFLKTQLLFVVVFVVVAHNTSRELDVSGGDNVNDDNIVCDNECKSTYEENCCRRQHQRSRAKAARPRHGVIHLV